MRSTRRATAWFALVTALAVTLAGCGGGGGGDGAGDKPVEGGTLTVAIHQDPASQLDIHVTAADISGLVLRNVFDSLVEQDPDGSFKPWLAKSWDVSEDGLQYTFKLRDDVKFQDGQPFNAEAVKANFDHVSNPATKSQYASSLLGADAYKSTEVVDEYTVRVNLSRPYAPLLQGLSTTYLGFYSPAVLTSSADKLVVGGKGITVGTGPFVFESQTAGQNIKLSKNPDYDWAPENATHTGPAHVDDVVFRILPEDTVRTGVITSGEADVATNISAGDVEGLEANDEVKISSTEAPGLPWSAFLNHSRGVFADQKVRQAFQRGIDISSVVTSVYGGVFDRAWSVLGPKTPDSYDKSLEGTWDVDTDLANQLLDEAGWTKRDGDGYRTKDGKRLSARWIGVSGAREDRDTLVSSFQADMKKIGFEIVVEPLDSGAYITKLQSGDYDIIDWSFIRADADILRLHLFSTMAPIQNASWVNDSHIDDLTLRASQSTDPAEREKLYQEVQKWVIDTAAIVPVYVPKAIVASSTKIGGLRETIYGWPVLYDVWTTRK